MVTRPGPRGNPFTEHSAEKNVELFRQWLTGESMHGMLPQKREEILRQLPELRGKKLACFCSLDSPCHGDILCEMANRLFVTVLVPPDLREEFGDVAADAWTQTLVEDECKAKGVRLLSMPSGKIVGTAEAGYQIMKFVCDTVPMATS